MKYTSTYLMMAFAAAFVLLAGITACNDYCEPKNTQMRISVMHDLTEAQIAKPSADEIIALYDLDSNKWSAAEFRYASITDVSLNRTTTVALADGGNRLLASSFTRDKEIERFTDSIRTVLSSLARDTAGRPHSSIYLPLAAELARLAASDGARVLLVYSDLMENEPSLSFYDRATMRALSRDPQSITAKLEAKAALPDLTGIEVHLIFQPADAGQDATYQVVSGFYRTLLESHGATVRISANVSAIAR